MPSAPWLMSADGTYKSQRGKRFKRVWCEVEYVADVDYTEEVLQLPKKCFTDRLPDGGFYKFRESGNRLWIIADRIKINRIIDEKERIDILRAMNYDEARDYLVSNIYENSNIYGGLDSVDYSAQQFHF